MVVPCYRLNTCDKNPFLLRVATDEQMVLRKPSSRSDPPVTRMDIRLAGLSKRIKERYLTNPKSGFRTFAQCLLFCIVLVETTVVAQRAPRSFSVEETTIAQIHAAMRE